MAPYYAYNHGACVVNYTGCHTGGSSITGVAFYQSGSYPTQYNGALFFADHTRNEIWAMLPGTNGLPDPSRLQSFVGVDTTGGAAGHPVDLKIGPGGDLFYVDMDDGTVHRISFAAANQPPTAVVTATSDQRSRPADRQLRRHGLVRPGREAAELLVGSQRRRHVRRRDSLDGVVHLYNGGRLSPEPAGHRRPRRERHSVGHHHGRQHRADRGHRLARVEPDVERSATQSTSPATPPTRRTGTLPASALTWSLILHHCFTPTDCHAHLLQTINGVSSGSVTAPDHAYPCWLELQLTATDSGGLATTTSVRLDPKTVVLTFRTNPGGLVLTNLVVNEAPRTTPFSVTVVVGSANSVSAPSPQHIQEIDLLLHVVVGRRRAEPHHHRTCGEYHIHRDLPQALRAARSPRCPMNMPAGLSTMKQRYARVTRTAVP